MNLFLHFLLLPFLLCPVLTYSLDVFLETGVHSEELSFKLTKRKQQFHESFDKVKSRCLSPEVRLGVFTFFCNSFSLEVNGGLIFSTPSSRHPTCRYREDMSSRTFTSHSHKKSDLSGNDFSVALGYFIPMIPKVVFIPLLGYAEQRRKLHLHPGHMKTHTDVHTDPQEVNAFNLHYSAHWHGPWLGFKLCAPLCYKLHFFFNAEYHRTLLKAKGKWHIHEILADGFNFDSQICSTQRGIAQGFKINAAIVHTLCAPWKIALHGYYAWLLKNNGKDSTKNFQNVLNHNQPVSQGKFRSTPHFHVQWHAWAILGVINYAF